ncbi:hypothetical protein UA75_16195 [Actinoalloteichus sp. GBA129-24]|uniref:Helix-turn-helix domain-containing protein n=1 Tax=Actinoalloteichus fjordicus TaxID=1612552 RepID=A0AAC9LCB1_9PSEU|nr:helix-turn-helix domain-containing protein [Actinoalloteichus fjordicus]APU15178.1 hypothetical protein UA74_15630 [Actinoalloteichus fjordicus]APU21247.1 hypothetical protein UA75_16195 [Actinoalloteichus sp. GBA129-24]
MAIRLPESGRETHYSVRQTAWVLNVQPAQVSRAVRLGALRARWRDGCPRIPATELVRLLGERHLSTDGGDA